ncbi:hypothetical protein [Pseudomonas schmalbachii]|nr:hypothetical protein [Pseudomonas schmalbachii]
MQAFNVRGGQPSVEGAALSALTPGCGAIGRPLANQRLLAE